jgi:hypothetical protein
MLRPLVSGFVLLRRVLPTVLIALVFVYANMASVNSQSIDSGYVLVRVRCFEIRALSAGLLEDDIAELRKMDMDIEH